MFHALRVGARAVSNYYEDQIPEAKKRSADFREARAPKYLDYFEGILKVNGPYLTGRRLTYADLSLSQIVAGLRSAFPRAIKKIEPDIPRLVELHDCVAARPNLRAYLESDRRIPFNESGIFRCYPALDG
jgi:glutathione S-transferase